MSSQHVKRLKNKKICLLGLGIENQAFLEWLNRQNLPCEVTICNQTKIEKRVTNSEERITYIVGDKNYDKNLEQYDIILRAPGYPLFTKEIQKAKKCGVEISSPMKLFFEFCPSKNIIGVTGTKGKGTTSSLIAHILKKSGKKVWLGGNIGIAPFSFIHKIKKTDWVVLELSSFQLEDMAASPHIAVITNFSREHLRPADPNNPNYHRSLSLYREAKLNIARWQGKEDYYVVNSRSESGIRNQELGGKIIKFGKLEFESNLVGEHNKENIAAAVTVARILKIKDPVIKKAVKTFKGLPHRIELVGFERGATNATYANVKTGFENGVKFYNDSFATIPEAAITAMKSFSPPIILLAGGADKGSSFKAMAKEIKKRVEFLVLFKGEGSEKIAKELDRVRYSKEKTRIVKSMAEAGLAVDKYIERSGLKNGVVLLSPGCASFGVFKNYKERGDLFRLAADKILKKSKQKS